MAKTLCTVITVDENGRTTSRLGRWTSRKKAVEIAALWTSLGKGNVQIVDNAGPGNTTRAVTS